MINIRAMSAGTRTVTFVAVLGGLLAINLTLFGVAAYRGRSTGGGGHVRSAAASPIAGAAEGVGVAALIGDCRDAVRKAALALNQAAGVEKALAQHTDVINQLLASRLSVQDALTRSVPLLVRGSASSTRLDRASADFRAAARRCPTP